MPKPRLACRTTVVSAAFVLALGASGVVATAAFADENPTAAPSSSAPADPTAAPTFTLTNVGGGSYSLNLTVMGTSIAVTYTLDTSGAVVTASTSTNGATVTVDGHDLTVTLVDGRAVKVELGDAGDTVQEVSVGTAESGDSQGANGDSQGANGDASQTDGQSSSAPAETQQPETQQPETQQPETQQPETQQPETQQPEPTSSQDSPDSGGQTAPATAPTSGSSD